MLCDVCAKKLATVHLTEIIEGKIVEVHLCEGCANKNTDELHKKFNLTEFLSDIVDIDSLDTVSSSSPICNHCGLTYQEFKKNGKLGCPQCYDIFKDHLNALLKKIQGSTQHKGKTPQVTLELKGSVKDRISELKLYLGRAIRLEEYEEAASLRDEIRKLERRLHEDAPN